MALAATAITPMAFVANPGTNGTTALTDAFSVTGMTITDATVLTTGVRTYGALADQSKKKYNTNELMYFGITMTVNNPTKTLAHTSAVGNEYQLLVSSGTADLSINTMTDVVLTHPYDSALANLISGENGAVKANASQALTYDANTNTLNFKLKVWNDAPNNANVNIGNEAFNLAIDETGTQSAVSYTIGFSAINRAEQNGSVTLKVSPTEYKFKDNTLTVSLNGRTYKIDKVAAVWAKASDTTNWPQVVKDSLSTIGYKLSIVNADKSVTEIVTFDTEVTSAEGYGQSLGFAKDGRLIVRSTIGNGYVYADSGTAAFTTAELAALETALSDFGFSISYNYKLQDRNFEQATTYKATFTTNYNVVDNEADVEEPLPDDELDEDEIIEDPEIDEDVPLDDELPEEDEEIEVPITGDSASAAALCLALAALGAVALAYAMKRTRE